jgi:hypothetical protein
LRPSVEGGESRVAGPSLICALLGVRSSEHRRDSLCYLGDAEQEKFICNSADQLKSDGEPSAGEAARDGDCRDAGEVRGTIQAEKQSAGRVIGFADGRGFFSDQRGGDWRCGDDERIYFGISHRLVKLPDEFVA